MTVSELIDQLKELDQDKDIEIHTYTYDNLMYDFLPKSLN